MSNDPIRPLHDVWLRPRRVFRELAAEPVGRPDLLLGAAQGIVGFLGYCRARNMGSTYGLIQLFSAAAVVGSVLGIVSLYVMGAIYARLGGGGGKAAVRRQMIHVLAYGAVPVAVSLGIWVFTALVAGDATFLTTPRPEDEGFVSILLSAQFISYLLLMIWSVILQVMGFSEVLRVTTGRAFAIWLLGQLVGALAALILAVIVTALIPTP
ncbi:MAG TPA: YIP1 family protein [Steroidobacteraceae bacterium]|nr:YIP1 family protein [Steroidobacteraceae bacterium]